LTATIIAVLLEDIIDLSDINPARLKNTLPKPSPPKPILALAG
jgi:hypothetical protein